MWHRPDVPVIETYVERPFLPSPYNDEVGEPREPPPHYNGDASILTRPPDVGHQALAAKNINHVASTTVTVNRDANRVYVPTTPERAPNLIPGRMAKQGETPVYKSSGSQVQTTLTKVSNDDHLDSNGVLQAPLQLVEAPPMTELPDDVTHSDSTGHPDRIVLVKRKDKFPGFGPVIRTAPGYNAGPKGKRTPQKVVHTGLKQKKVVEVPLRRETRNTWAVVCLVILLLVAIIIGLTIALIIVALRK